MTYVFSDPHGHYDKYKAMLEAISFRPSDTLYVLGDVIDRGPDGIKILWDMMSRPNVIPILGNHEFTAALCLPWLLWDVTDQRLDDLGTDQVAALQEWVLNGGGPTLQALKELALEDREEILDYLREMELYAEVEAGGRSFVLVHAGLDHFDPDRPLEDYAPNDFLFSRPDPDRTYFPDRLLVFGHTPTRLLRQLGWDPEDAILRRGNQIAIDCGCGFDGRLGCLCLETLDEFYV